MKSSYKRWAAALVAAIIFTMTGCPLDVSPPPQIPVAADYTIGKLTQTAGSVTAVTITAKAGKSSGARTIYYEGISPTSYAKSTTVPQTVGSYSVTFDVAAAEGWGPAYELSAGTLKVNPSNQTPTAADYDISGNLTQTAGSVTEVTVTPQSDKSSGARTIYYEGISPTSYTKSTTVPQSIGSYAVTFNVAAVTGWNAVNGLFAGTLTVNDKATPVAEDYDISGNFTQTAGSVTAITVTPRSGKSSGARTIYYEGISPTSYTKTTTIPQTAGSYVVTFDIAAAGNFNAATGLFAGTVTVNAVISGNQTPGAGDYDIGNLVQTAGNVSAVTITPQSGKSPGTVTVLYNGSATIPQSAGSYPVTFNVAAVTGWNAVNGLFAGTLTVNPAGSINQTPVADDYNISDNLTQIAWNVTAVTVTPKAGKSNGARTIYYEGISPTSYTKNKTIPQSAGSYAVTFNVAAATGWNAASGLSAGTLNVIQVQTPVADDYDISNLAQTEGSVTAVTVMPKTGKSNGARTIYYEGISPTSYTKSTTIPQSRGSYAVTFNVAAATGWNAASGLSAGTLWITRTPVANDYVIGGNLTQPAGKVTAVTVTPQSYIAPYGVTVYYNGSTTIPQTAGSYAVTFDVPASYGWNAAYGLYAGTLEVYARTIAVGTQNGSLGAGVAGSVTFTVTTTNFSYGGRATVANLPTGVTASENVSISGNSGTLTLTGNASTVQGTTSTLTLTIDGVTSETFTLTISRAYNIGDTGPGGGIIFYFAPDGFTFYQTATDTIGITVNYLEAAPDAMETPLAWTSHTDTLAPFIQGTSTEFGTGMRNTALILNIDANAPAAKACKDLTTGGKTDWFLPSWYEADTMSSTLNRDDYYQSYYWSSSQFWSEASFAWASADAGSRSKKAELLVRAVRAF